MDWGRGRGKGISMGTLSRSLTMSLDPNEVEYAVG